MTTSPSTGWREVYEWCLVEQDSHHDHVDDLDDREEEERQTIDDGEHVQNNGIRREV